MAAFIRQYLVAVGRLIGPEDSDADYFRKLLDDHHSLLEQMSGVLGEEEGENRVREMVPEPHAHYRDTVVRLAEDFVQEPTRLRDEVREMLTSRRSRRGYGALGCTGSWKRPQALGIPGCISWVLAFHYRQVRALLEVPSHCRNMGGR